MIPSKKLDDLDLLLASFYEDDLLPVDRRFVDAMVSLYSLFRKCYNERLRHLAK